MPSTRRNLVIVGDTAFAEVAFEYFTHDSDYAVAAFAVEKAFLTREMLFGLPVVPLEQLPEHFPARDHDVYTAVVYSQLNRLRTRLSVKAKALGYRLASYVSSRAFVSKSATIGEHCFVFENNVIQPFVKVENNVVLWSGNHVGHHSTIRANCFISSHVVVSGYCEIGQNSFLGVNATVTNNVRIGRDCWIGPGVVIANHTRDGEMFRAPKSVATKVSTRRFFGYEP